MGTFADPPLARCNSGEDGAAAFGATFGDVGRLPLCGNTLGEVDITDASTGAESACAFASKLKRGEGRRGEGR